MSRPGASDGSALSRFNRRTLLTTTLKGAAAASLASVSVTPRQAGAQTPIHAPQDGASRSAPVRALFVGHGTSESWQDPSRAKPLHAMRPASVGAWIVLTPHRRTDVVTVAGAKGGRALPSLAESHQQTSGHPSYPSPAAPALATEIIDRIDASGLSASHRGHAGFHHTVWGPLRHLSPTADVPVIEVGLPFTDDKGFFALGQALAPLATSGAVVLASGQLTHNLGEGRLPAGAPPPTWAEDFDAWATQSVLARDVDALIDWRHQAPAHRLAHPDDGGHFRVLLVAAGFAAGAPGGWQTATSPHQGFEGGTFSERAFTLG